MFKNKADSLVTPDFGSALFEAKGGGLVAYYLGGSLLVLLLIIAVVFFVFLYQKKVLQLKAKLHNEELRAQQAVFDALQEGQEKERARFAEELHDGIGAKLSGLKMSLEYLQSNATEHKMLIAKIFSGVAETLEEVRVISHNLLFSFFSNKDLEQILQRYIEELNTMSGCRYDLYMNKPIASLDTRIKVNCYHIISELLHNIHKHAKASEAFVQINIEADKVEIAVEDNGIGFDNRHDPQGIGLKNIKNRVTICNGTISIDTSGHGTSVIIEIPLNAVV